MLVAPPEHRNIGFVYQDFMLFPHRTVQRNIEFGLIMRKEKNVREKVEEIVELVGITNLLQRYPGTLSGGEKQRVSLARALVLEPAVLLLDEPLSALDALTQKKLREELKKIHKETGVTAVHVTHEREEVLVLADRIGIINEGRIVQTGIPEEIFRKPNSRFVASFVGSENLFLGCATKRAEITEVRIKDVILYSTARKSGKVNVSVRPEDIIVSPKPIHTSARNNLQGKIIELKDRGAVIELVVDCNVLLKALITRQSFLDLGINVGTNVYLSFKASVVHLF